LFIFPAMMFKVSSRIFYNEPIVASDQIRILEHPVNYYIL